MVLTSPDSSSTVAPAGKQVESFFFDFVDEETFESFAVVDIELALLAVVDGIVVASERATATTAKARATARHLVDDMMRARDGVCAAWSGQLR
jgi:hypothetical protein